MNLVGTPAELVTWSSGQEGELLTGVSAGGFSFTFTDINGCTSSGSVDVSEPDPVLVVVVPEHAVSGADGGLSWTIFGGVPPYEQTLNGELVTGTSHSGLSAGDYEVSVTDSNGCSVTVGIELLLGVGLDELNVGTIGLYPNPAIDQLRITAQDVWSSWRITDMDGRIMLTGSRPNDGSIDVSPLASGAYLLELMVEAGGQARIRFMKN